MPFRGNPFYRPNNPGISAGFSGLAAAMFPGGVDPRMQSGAVENMAQARQADAAAGYNIERTRGERFANDVRASSPTSIAELLLGGGVIQDDPLQVNPDYQPYQGTDLSNILAAPVPAQDNSSVFMPSRSARDKLAEAVTYAASNKIPLDQLLKAAGISGFTQRVAGDNPDSALGFAPFVGVNPNTQTSFTPGRQDSISARDSAEDIAKQETINRTNVTREEIDQAGRDRRNDGDNRTSIERERIQQGGASERTRYQVDNRPVTAGNNVDVIVTPAQGRALGIRPNADGQYVVRGRATVGTGQDQLPGTAGGDPVAGRDRSAAAGRGGAAAKPTSVPNTASKQMRTAITEALKADGISSPDANVISGLLSAAETEWQSSKSPSGAADTIIQRLRAGEAVNGVSINKSNRTLAGVPIPGTERRQAVRNPAAPAPANDPIALARDAIARGADRNAVIKRLRENGIDPKGL